MKEYQSEHTGNVTYTSDDGRFSSMSKRYVRLWEETQQGKKLEASDYIFWMCAGHLKEERGATQATETRHDSILNEIRENKLRNMKDRRVRLTVKKQKVLEKVWTDFNEARTRFAFYRLRKDYNDLSEKGKLLIETQTKMGVWLIHPANVGPGLQPDDPRIVEDDMEEWALKGFQYEMTFHDEYDLWKNPATMQNLRRYKDGSVWVTDIKTGEYQKLEKSCTSTEKKGMI